MLLPSPPPTGRSGEIEIGTDVVAPQVALAALSVDGAPGVRAVSLRPLGDRLFYEFTLREGGVRLVDARSATTYEVDDATALRLARRAVGRNAGAATVTRMTTTDKRYRGSLPAYRVGFTGARTPTVFVSTTGNVTVTEAGFRVKSMAGALHSFVVPGITTARPRFRKALLVIASVATLALIVSGYVLLFPLRRRDAA